MIIKLRNKATEAAWTSSTYILETGEAGIALDTGAIRVGNGVDVWSDLPVSSSKVTSVNTRTGDVVLTKTDVALGSVDNTSDLAKPISSAQAAINAAVQDQIDGLGATGGVTAESIGLGEVDNTADLDKPTPSVTQLALNLKAPLNNPIFTGTVQGITKSMVGLAQVDNTSDLNKPISTATQTALNGKASSTDSRLTDTRLATPGTVTNASVAITAAISLDKTADSPTRVTMRPDERATIVDISTNLNNIHHGVVTAGDDALGSLVSPPTTSSIVAVGPESLAAATSITSSVAVGDHAIPVATNAVNCVAIGDYTLGKMTSTGKNNIAIGNWAARGITSATGVVALGINAGSARNNNDDIALGRNANAGVAFTGMSGTWEVHGTVASDPTTASNTALGAQALRYNIDGTNNIAVGINALKSVTDTNSNIAVGTNALGSLGNKRGPAGKAIIPVAHNGTYSWDDQELTLAVSAHGVSVGDVVTLKLTAGTFVADAGIYDGQVRGLVHQVVDPNTFTVTEVFTGVPIKSLTDDGNVTLVAYERDAYTDVADSNAAFGLNSGSGVYAGVDNLFLGHTSGPQGSSSVSSLIAIGKNSFSAVTTSAGSMAIGVSAGSTVTNPTDTVLIGKSTSAPSVSTSVTVLGSSASATGNSATAVGKSSVAAATGVAVGVSANAGSNGIVIGNSSAATGSVVVGASSTSSGTASASLGHAATTGYNGVSVGDHAVSADGGTALGKSANAGTNGIAIGNGVTAGANTAVFATDSLTTNIQGSTINIGTTLSTSDINIGAASSTIDLGTSNLTGTIGLHASLVVIDDAGTTSDARDKADVRDTTLGLDFINSVRPVEYRWARREDRKQGRRYHQGVIAQEVKDVIDSTGKDFGGYIDRKVNGGPDKLLVRYDEFVAPLIKSVQELSEKVKHLESHQCQDCQNGWV